ncbi:MAG: hypothetical protein K6F09_03025 [Clostridiales bacterium]|nr:hypothetical protein [Clostridiales bacterium]
MEKTDKKTQENSCISNHWDKPIYFDKAVFCGDKIKDKNIILNYLYSCPRTWFTTGRVIDHVKNVQIETRVDNVRSDGEYEWSETDIYHFEKYDMPLNDEFINHVLNKQRSS